MTKICKLRTTKVHKVSTVWNCLPPSVNYSTLAPFRHSIELLTLLILHRFCMWLILLNVIAYLPYVRKYNVRVRYFFP